MKKFFSIFLALSLIALPVLAQADAGWSTLLVAAAPFHFWYIALVSIGIEAAVFAFGFHLSPQRALRIAVVANVASAVAGLIVGGAGFFGLMSALYERLPAFVEALAENLTFAWIFLFLLTLLVEIPIVRLFEKREWKRLLITVLSANILTYALMIGFLEWVTF